MTDRRGRNRDLAGSCIDARMLKEGIKYLEEVQIKCLQSRVTHSEKPRAVVEPRVSHFWRDSGHFRPIGLETERAYAVCGAAKSPPAPPFRRDDGRQLPFRPLFP